MTKNEKLKFKTGKTYKGCGFHGFNSVTITKVTDKTVEFTHNMGTNRAKIFDVNNTFDAFRFKDWVFYADDIYQLMLNNYIKEVKKMKTKNKN